MKTITIDPITRLEGHGKIEIFLNERGDVENAYLQIPELRGFERFCEGRRAEDMPIITPRICGVCPVAHHFAATKALDAAYHVEPTETAKKLRELMNCGYYIYDHTLHFYFLGGPDFVVGPDAPPAERNIFGVLKRVGLDVGKEVIKHRAYGQRITETLGGKATHPTCGVPGGISKGLNEEERQSIEDMARSSIEFAKFTLGVFNDIVLANQNYVDLILSDPFQLDTYNMGTVDKDNHVNFIDGDIRVTDQRGKEYVRFGEQEYLDHICEHVEPWTYSKFTYLRNIGWKGFTDGPESGIYRVGPLGRLNAADGMATPQANEEYKRMFKTLGGRPVQSTLAFHWARLVELLYAAERALELAKDPGITDTDLRNIGWNGFTDGPESGIYRVGPLGRLNAADGMATPQANEEYKRMFKTLGGRPVQSTLAFHWARLVELLYAAERALELAKDPGITDTDLRNPVGEPGEGVGIVEAARGTLIHHYKLDSEGLVKKANLIVATTNNYADICMSIRDAAKGLIKGGNVNDGLLNMVEMSFRAYDPCFGCSTHALPGQMPLRVNIYDSNKQHLKTVQRD